MSGRSSVCLRVIACGLVLVVAAGCDSVAEPAPADTVAKSSRPAPPQTPTPDVAAPRSEHRPVAPSRSRLTTFPRFEEVASQAGLEFTYTNGASGRVLMVEATGGGAGWLDFDSDGWLDVYFCQGGDPASESRESEPVDQLFRQVEPGRFVSVTAAATVAEHQYGQGVAVADFDDDGFDDIYVTNVGQNTLLRNQGDGTYLDVTPEAGVAGKLWSTSAAWGDLDGDGDLDLYVCNYVDYDPYHPILCGTREKPGTCHPMHVNAVPDACYFNVGDGTFLDESQSRGMHGEGNKALGVVISDLNQDGRLDVYVANDTTPNFLFVNQGKGQFEELAQQLGCAVSRDGHAQASMGVAFGDYDRDGWLDLYCTHFTKESNTLYRNLGSTGFQDVTGLVGLHAPTLDFLGFGTIMADFNQDGHADIFVTNGHVDDWRQKGDALEMKPQLFSFDQPRFVEASEAAGEYFAGKWIGRGVACGDFDNDGDWDLAVVHQNSPVALLRNDSDRGNWLKLRCVAAGNRRGV
ncbi:MAG TPA: FG-GAP-like repeat-containing protein, partial [Planctomycetaceae bacterium]|nr:FG-GAP-like repeat-containing protein [Planctomycetaceae bacterium]